MLEGHHPPIEEYLEAVHDLEEEGEPVIQARLAERLGHSAPTVSETIRRLRDEGYLTIERRAIFLTPEGRNRAESVVRKHRLAERLLTDIIGLEWHNAHSEATRWEHVISDEVERRLVKLLGNPSTCPHGNPIPGTNATFAPVIRLNEASVGQRVRLERVTEQVEFDKLSLMSLSEHGFMPGIVATVLHREQDGAMVLDVGGRQLSIAAGLSPLLYIAAPDADDHRAQRTTA